MRLQSVEERSYHTFDLLLVSLQGLCPSHALSIFVGDNETRFAVLRRLR